MPANLLRVNLLKTDFALSIDLAEMPDLSRGDGNAGVRSAVAVAFLTSVLKVVFFFAM